MFGNRTSNETSFPGDRELIATVYTNDHGDVKVYMPSLRDYLDNPPEDDEGVYKLMAVCVGVPWEDFQNWPQTDIVALTEILGDAINKLKPHVIKV